MKSSVSLYQNKTFMKLFSSYSISMLGIYFDRIAVIMLFAFLWNERPLMLALIPVAFALPQALLSQFAGVWVGRFSQVRVMMFADLVSALLTLVLAFTNQPWLCIVILALRSTITTVHFPAQQSLIKRIVHKDQLLKAISLNGTVSQLSKVIGPLLGATLAGLYSPQFCILLNFVALLISFVILLTMSKEVSTQQDSTQLANQKLPFWQLWREGWSIVIKTRMLLFGFALSFFTFFVIQMIDVQFPILVRELAPQRPELFGWVMSSSGFGALLTITILMRFKQVKAYGTLLGVSIGVMGATFLSLGLLKPGVAEFTPIGIGIILGAGVGLFTIITQYLLQDFTTEETVGRVSGMYNSLMSVTLLVAPLLGAWLVELFDVASVLIGTALGLLLLSLIGFLSQRTLSSSKKSMETSKLPAAHEGVNS
ncbi:MFS transporter [Bacillus horti]|uniref:MFS family permease n=1 Tax=Caldalkalibacillus horti TaxID=77523 RepID=A0ABT9VV86_9BACI|nr:MFS transporter [Bacillus horti]MDQ0164904.1 MFS family permease [Bacillus horti]